MVADVGAEGGGFAAVAWVVAVLPFASAVLTFFLGKRSPGKGSIYGIGTMAVGLVLSLGVLGHFVRSGPTTESATSWFSIGSLRLELGQYVDGLTAVILVVVT